MRLLLVGRLAVGEKRYVGFWVVVQRLQGLVAVVSILRWASTSRTAGRSAWLREVSLLVSSLDKQTGQMTDSNGVNTPAISGFLNELTNHEVGGF